MMNFGKNAVWLFFILFGLAFSGWYFASSDNFIQLDEKVLTHTVDTIINDLVVKEYNDDGLLINSLQSSHVKHTPFEDKHWFKNPYIHITQKDEAPWVIQAHEAVSYDGGKKMILNDDVRIKQTSHQDQISTITTSQLTYYPKEKIAISDQHVLFEQKGTKVESQGIKAWLSEKRVKLLSQARGKYDPKHG